MVAVLGAGVYQAAQYFVREHAQIISLQKETADVREKLAAVSRQLHFLADATAHPLPPQKDDEAQKEIDQLKQRLETLSKEQQKPAPKTEQDMLTATVAHSTPAVVSVVISKDVPQLETVYVNPFGDDPFFKDSGFRVPTFRQKGVQRKKVGAGTGFIISAGGTIITNKHVVADEGAEYTVLLSTGDKKTARVLYRDAENDVAILKIDGKNYPTLTFGDSKSLKLGQTVIAIGNALGEYNNSVSQGIIAGLDRKIQPATGNGNIEELSGVIQTTAAINPGNSGGPLLTLDGRVVGVNVATVLGTNSISFSIPSALLKDIIKSYVK